MTYKLKFLPSAKKEWDSLDNSIKAQFKNKLRKCLENPHIPSNKLRDLIVRIKLNFAQQVSGLFMKLMIKKSSFLLSR